MYIEASSPRKQGDVARLISQTYPPTSGKCLTFAYHMYGYGMGMLTVYAKKQGQLGAPIWGRSGNFGNRWNIGQITLNSNSPFQVNRLVHTIVGKLS